MKLRRKSSTSIGILNLKNLNIMEKRPIFKHPDFGEVRILVRENGEVWFILTDVCKILDLQTNKVKERLNPKGWNTIPLLTKGGTQQIIIINEPNFYRLILQSRKPIAEKFQDWIVEEVLPSIRRHGAYLTPEKTEELITNPDLIIEIAQALKTERAKIVEMQPKVEFAERIANYSDKVFDIGETAKILKLSYGRNTLFQHLREMDILMKYKNEPYQKYIDSGYFKLDAVEISIGGLMVYESKIYITGKGLKWLEGKLKENNLL
ncbi:hypothetical protein FACS1894179_04300 [Bacteroidia bacterium]|nr:hypothetical protein FACS1894169_07650 [Bacteroidia bacterium]GHV39416.1 hypothetical protein FACS1894179_04300 [Bacteroidia bacterium]